MPEPLREVLPPTAFLVGERVFLRALDESDVDVVLRTVSNPDLRPWLQVTVPFTRAAELHWLQTSIDPASHVTLGICERATARLLGTVTLRNFHLANRHAELGIAVNEAGDRGRGFGGEAMRLMIEYGFRELNLHRIYLHVYERNPSRRLYARLGFREEGRLREHVFKGGGWQDVVVMGLLASEWAERRA